MVIDLSYNYDRFYDRGMEEVLEKIQKRTNISYKFWVTGDEIEPTSKIISSIIPRIYKVDAEKILASGTILFNDFVCFSKNAENVDLSYSNVKNENSSHIPKTKLVKALPKLKVLTL
uniref:Uncharacterized protein n=1 Tax=Panagrolaimus davidi TaxID=227884 RepID=A0A914Q790_9BILA